MDTAEHLKNDKDFQLIRGRLDQRRVSEGEEALDVAGDLSSNSLTKYDAANNSKRKQMAAAKKGHLRPTFEPDARIYTDKGWEILDATQKKWERKAISLAGLVKEFRSAFDSETGRRFLNDQHVLAENYMRDKGGYPSGKFIEPRDLPVVPGNPYRFVQMFQRYVYDDEARRKLLREEKDAITKEFNEMRRAISVFREYCDDRKKLTYAECERRAIEQKRYYVKSDDDEEPALEGDGGSSSTDDDQSSEDDDDGGKPEGIMPPGADWDHEAKNYEDRKLTPEEEAQKILENAEKSAKDIEEITGPLTNGDTSLAQLGKRVVVVKQGGGPSKKPKPNDDGDDEKEPGGDLDLLANQSKHKDIGSWIYFRDRNDSREKFGYAEVIDGASKKTIHNFVKAHIADEKGDEFILEFRTKPDWKNIQVKNQFVNYWKTNGPKEFRKFMK